MICVPKIFTRVFFASAITVASAAGAEATPIVNPDLTVSSFFGTPSLAYDGTDFTASCSSCLLSWTTSSGLFGGASLGDFSVNWSQTSHSGAFLLTDLDGTDSGILGTLLAGTVSGFAANVFNPGPGAVFATTLLLTTTNLGFGNSALINFSSFDFSGGAGTTTVDVVPAVPEPATLSLVGLGAVIMAARRRRAARRRDTSAAT
jgi:hypothetical protein